MAEITFHNKPTFSGHQADKVFDERRAALSAQLENFIAAHSRFADKDVGIIFATKGISSLIAILETSDEKSVLKIPLSTGYSEGEALFLKTWEKAGVKVPHILDAGMLGEHSYVLMEYIDAPILDEAFTPEELSEKGTYLEMGRILRVMHTPEAEGYGRVIDGKAEYKSFKDWLFGPDIEERIRYVEEHNLLGEECGSISDARAILLNYVGESSKSSYCHDDFGASNIFATEPLTVFDPNPRFNNGYIDIGRSALNSIAAGISPKQLIKGYFGDEAYDEKVLHASIFLTAAMKMPYKHKTGNLGVIETMREYLRQNKNLLKS